MPDETPTSGVEFGDAPAASAAMLLNVEGVGTRRVRRSILLRAAGFDVIEAVSAGEALVIATRHRLSLALVDFDLPDSSGIPLCDTLKRLNPEMPVVLISSSGVESEAREAGTAAGANGLLVEPVAEEALVGAVRSALNGESSRAGRHTWIVTDDQGVILHASAEGAKLLSGTPRSVQQRSLLVFFEQDRDAWREAMSRAWRGERVMRSGRLRPKERRPITVQVEIKNTIDEVPPALVWTFSA